MGELAIVFEKECNISYEAGLMYCPGPITEEVAAQIVPNCAVGSLVSMTRRCWEAGLENQPMPRILMNECGVM